MAIITTEKAGGSNVCAFLDMLAISELGEKLIAHSDNGYNVIVGSYYISETNKNLDLMTSYKDHPRKLINLPKLGIKSSAAGRYQILMKFYDAYKVQLKLPDFSPLSQDLIALQLIRECKALDLIKQGKIAQAIYACKSRWASLPGAGYGQNEHTVDHLLKAFTSAGGKLP